MKRTVVVLIGMLCAMVAVGPAVAASSMLETAGMVGLATLGGLAGAVVAVTAIGEMPPELDSRLARTAVVIGSLTVFDGWGAAVGVLTAGRVWHLNGSVRGCILGGLAGGLASAFTEPLLYWIGVPEGITEFLGMALLPVLPAIGATLGFDR